MHLDLPTRPYLSSGSSYCTEKDSYLFFLILGIRHLPETTWLQKTDKKSLWELGPDREHFLCSERATVCRSTEHAFTAH